MDSNLRYTLYEPCDQRASLYQHFDRVPRFLLRTWSQNSNGRTSSTCVESGAVMRGCLGADILGRSYDWTTNMLKDHLNWKHRDDDNFVSWKAR